MKINYDEMTVEDGGILYTMEDLSLLSTVYKRLSLANYLYENQEQWNIKLNNMEIAYKVADIIRDKVDDICECEGEVINDWVDDIIKWVKEDA